MSLFHVYKHKVDNACWGWQGSSVSMDFGGHMDGLYISTMGPAQCHPHFSAEQSITGWELLLQRPRSQAINISIEHYPLTSST